MNKTMYVPENEAETWEKARRLANDRLSPVILRALKEYIMTKEAEAAEAAGFERIELEFEDSDDNHLPKRKAFHGKWILPPEGLLRPQSTSISQQIVNQMVADTDSSAYAVAVTAKGNVVVYMWKHKDEFDPVVGEYESKSGYKFLVFPSFEAAAQDGEVNNAIREAVRKRGVPVEELDI